MKSRIFRKSIVNCQLSNVAKRSALRMGYTMVELLVAFTMFAVVLSIVTSIFITSYRSQRAITELVTANDNTYLAIEQMARDVRDGIDFKFGAAVPCPGPDDCFEFTNRNGDTVRYELISGGIVRTENSDSKLLTADNINIRSFRVTPNDCLSGNPVRITLNLKVSTRNAPNVENIENIIQTTIATRNLATCVI